MTVGITVNVNEEFEGKVISDNFLVENFSIHILFDSKSTDLLSLPLFFTNPLFRIDDYHQEQLPFV